MFSPDSKGLAALGGTYDRQHYEGCTDAWVWDLTSTGIHFDLYSQGSWQNDLRGIVFGPNSNTILLGLRNDKALSWNFYTGKTEEVSLDSLETRQNRSLANFIEVYIHMAHPHDTLLSKVISPNGKLVAFVVVPDAEFSEIPFANENQGSVEIWGIPTS